MQEHPVPQNVTSFEFKLIGDLTLRQFGYVATGAIFALIFYFASTKVPSPLLKYTLFGFAATAAGIGIALAFVPVEGRPLDRWLVSFFNAIFGNTMYVWKKEGVEINALHGLHTPISTPTQLGPKLAANVITRPAEYTKNQLAPKSQPLSALDEEEQQTLHRITNLKASPFHAPSGNMSPALHQKPLNQHQPTRPGPHPVVHPKPAITSFAGPAKPANTLHSGIHSVRTIPPQPTLMREPHQRPLAPKRIPLPAYQMATLMQPPQTPMTDTGMLTTSIGVPTFGPSRPMAPLNNPQLHAQNQQVKILEQQNQVLLQRIIALEHQMQAGGTSQQNQAGQQLKDHLAAVENTLTRVQQNLTNVTQEESKYQSLLTELTAKLDQTTEQKSTSDTMVQKLEKTTTQQQQALAMSEEQRRALEVKLLELQKQLDNTKLLSQTLNDQKVQLERSMQAMIVPNTPTGEGRNTEAQLSGPAIVTSPISATTAFAASSANQSTQNTQIPTPVSQVQHFGITPKIEVPSNTPPALSNEAEAQSISAAISDQSLPTLTTIPNAISGYIFDINNKPLIDAIVVVKKAGGPTMRALKSNRVGQFSMVSPLPDGPYEISYEKDGYTFPINKIEANGQVIPPIKVLGKPIS